MNQDSTAMTTTTSLLLSTFLLALFIVGCSDSTGQDYEGEIAQDQTYEDTRSRKGSDNDDWNEHRRNFGDRRSNTSSADDESEWDAEYEREADWQDEEFERNMDELRRELDGLVNLDNLEQKLKSIERERGEALEDVDWDQVQISLDEAFESLGEAFSEVGTAISGGIDVESIEYDELKDVLPSNIRGYNKKNFSGDKVSVFGLNLSVLEQEYESNRGDGTLNITVVDLGSLANAALVGLDWLDLEVKSESSTGYEQTTTIDGYPAFEECDRSYGEDACSLHVVVAERFVVQLESNKMAMKDIRNVLDKMDIRKLEKLSNADIR